jgi:hypothetical protein
MSAFDTAGSAAVVFAAGAGDSATAGTPPAETSATTSTKTSAIRRVPHPVCTFSSGKVIKIVLKFCNVYC